MSERLAASLPRDTVKLPLPARFAGLILAFAPLFVHRSWRHAQLLLIGAILTPRRRTVASALRMMGRAQDWRFVNVHRILNRAARCPRAGGCILLGLLSDAFAPRGPAVTALDDTIERRGGKRIASKGIYRDLVRSSDSHFVKASGLRWMSLMLLAPIPWAGQVWALPFLTALVPSERACREQGHRHKPLLDVVRQLTLQARRWFGGKLYRPSYAGHGAPGLIGRPGLRQEQPPVDQRLAVAACISQEHADLAVLDAPAVPEYCRAKPTECAPFLRKPVSSTTSTASEAARASAV